MWIPDASVNFSIEENPKNVFVINYHRKTFNVGYKPRLA